MVSKDTYKRMAMAFEEATEAAHFDKISFRVNKKIFGTLDVQKDCAGLRLSPIQQSVFTTFDPETFKPASGNWGKQGWTTVMLQTVRQDMLQDALTLSYYHVAPKRYIDHFKTLE